MQIHLLAFGKLKTPGLRESFDYYSRLLGAWNSFKETELKPIEIRERSDTERARVQNLEAEMVRHHLSKLGGTRPLMVLLDESGKNLTTELWAENVRKWESASSTALFFVIGGALGLAPELRKEAAAVLSLGSQTLSHDLARVVLAEQLYRAWSVVRGHPYHVSG